MTVDVQTALPRNPGGSRSTALWGMGLLVVLEAMVIGSMIVSYFYLRVMSAAAWPPAGIAAPDLLLPSVGTALLVVSVVPMAAAVRATRRGRRRPQLAGLGGALLLLAAYLAVSVLEAGGRTYAHSTNAYGSVVWTLSGYQEMHAIGLLLLGGVVAVRAARGRVGPDSPLAVEITALYWYFVAASSVATYATLSIAPHLI